MQVAEQLDAGGVGRQAADAQGGAGVGTVDQRLDRLAAGLRTFAGLGDGQQQVDDVRRR